MPKTPPNRSRAMRGAVSAPGFAASAAPTRAAAGAETTLRQASGPTPEMPALAPELLALAPAIHTGRLPCELGGEVRVEAMAQHPGYFDVRGKGFAYQMHPVLTSTGAVRLEDPERGGVWLQLPHKSMLMNQRKGQRMADACQSPAQAAFAKGAIQGPALFDDVPKAAPPPAPQAGPADMTAMQPHSSRDAPQ
ncbi:MAG: hypothetical protein OHK0048_05660 [Rhodoferax sp.]